LRERVAAKRRGEGLFRRASGQLRQKCFKHPIRILQNIVVPIANHPIAGFRKPPITFFVSAIFRMLADVNFSEGRDREAVELLRQVANDYSYTEWGKRAAQRLRAQR